MTKNLLFTRLNSCKRSILVFLFTMFICLGAFAQTRQITGTVTAADDGTPIPGVTVKVKGTTTGAVTGAAGTFRLSAPADATLVFSYLSYVTQEAVVGNSSVSACTQRFKRSSCYWLWYCKTRGSDRVSKFR